MVSEAAAEHQPASSSLSLSLPARSRRQVLGWTLLGLLLPVSILTALVVLYVMSSASAAATGGCGGG
jgi:hypothetical protein